MKMHITDVTNREELTTLVINELKELGVKHRKEKKTAKIVEDKAFSNEIFQTHLHLLDMAHVLLSNGYVVEVPKFVSHACHHIYLNKETEGIFRKAGSAARQRDIRIKLEAGLPLHSSYHVIDVANVVKYFFRELPEPFIPPYIQETLLRCLLVDKFEEAVLLTCLLLPTLTLNTLTYFMQILRDVALSEPSNKMGCQALAIIVTPSLMPLEDMNCHRLNNQMKTVQILIRNSKEIGNIPQSIIDKMQINEVVQPKKKRNRRSEMFNGIRKIVGSAMSSEHLENSPDNNKPLVPHPAPMDEHRQEQLQPEQNQPCLAIATPCIKASKKRKEEPVCAFSAKKKKDLLGLLPGSSGGFQPNTPLIKESKKSRMSLGGNRHSKEETATAAPSHPVTALMERRWSIVGSGWPRGKNKSNANIKKDYQSHEDIFASSDMSDKNTSEASTLVTALEVPPSRDSQHLENHSKLKQRTSISGMKTHGTADTSKQATATGKMGDTVCRELDGERSDGDGEEFVHIPKKEYEQIRERVAAIESKISKEFGELSDSYAESVANSREKENRLYDRVVSVQNKYEKVVQQTEALTTPGTEQLAKRLGRGLKIRRSVDQKVIRSPSARKIGTIRRRSEGRVRLSRNQTWHLSSTSQRVKQQVSEVMESQQPLHPEPLQEQSQPDSNLNSFYARSNLKRGRPNTLHTGLNPQQYTPILEKRNEVDVSSEQWTSGVEFFSDAIPSNLKPKALEFSDEHEKPLILEDEENLVESTPVRPRCRPNMIDVNHTPMLPPKSVPRRQCILKTPNSKLKASTPTSRLTFEQRTAGCTPLTDDNNGRESIARLRAQNAGMVMAKAKLFDRLGEGKCDGESAHTPVDATARARNTCVEGRKISKMSTPAATSRTVTNSFSKESPPNVARKPKVNHKSPATINKRSRLSIPAKYTMMSGDNAVQSTAKPNESSLYTKLPTNATHKPRIIPGTPKTQNSLTTGTPRFALTGGSKAYRNSPRLAKMKNARN